MAPNKPGRAISLKSYLNLFEIQHVLLWKDRLHGNPQSVWDKNPAVSTHYQALIKTCGNFVGSLPLYR